MTVDIVGGGGGGGAILVSYFHLVKIRSFTRNEMKRRKPCFCLTI